MACHAQNNLSLSQVAVYLAASHPFFAHPECMRAILKINIFRNPLGVATLIHNDVKFYKYTLHTYWLLSAIE